MVDIHIGTSNGNWVSTCKDFAALFSPLVAVVALALSVLLPPHYRKEDRRARARSVAQYVASHLEAYVAHVTWYLQLTASAPLATALMGVGGDSWGFQESVYLPDFPIPPDFAHIRDIHELDIRDQASITDLMSGMAVQVDTIRHASDVPGYRTVHRINMACSIGILANAVANKLRRTYDLSAGANSDRNLMSVLELMKRSTDDLIELEIAHKAGMGAS